MTSFVLRHRWAVVAGWCLVTAALGWAGSRITLKADITDLLPEGTASGDDLRFYLERFGTADAFFISLSAPGSDDPAADLEDAAAKLSSDLTATGLVRSVRYGFTEEEGIDLARRAMAHLPVLLDVEKAADLRERLAPDRMRAALNRLKAGAAGPMMMGPVEELAREDPLGLLPLLSAAGLPAGLPVRPDPGSGLLLSPDGGTLLVIATPVKPPQDVDFSKDLIAAVERAEREGASAAPAIRFDHAGGYLFAVQDEARIRHDITITSALSMAAIVGLFALVLRRVGLLLILVVPLSLSMVWTLGVASIYPGHLNVVTVAFAAILLGMGDDSLTHLYLRYREEIAGGADRMEALRAAMGSTGPSILVATLTSGIGFGALMFVQFRGLSELGLIAAIGMLSLLVSTFVLFPCLLSLGSAASRPLAVPMGPFIRFHAWGMRHRAAVLGAMAALVLAAAAACTRLEFSSDLATLRGRDPARESLERVLAPFGGLPDPIQIVASAGSLEASLQASERWIPLCEALRREGAITGFSSPATWLPSEATQRARWEAMAGAGWDEAARRLREAAASLDLREEFFAPFLANLGRYGRWEEVRIDPASVAADPRAGPSAGLAAGVAATSLFPAPGRTPSQVIERARALDPDALGPSFRAASVGLVVADLTRVIESDFGRASAIALTAVALTALVAFRRLSRLMLVGCPVIVGCVLMLGGLAALRVPINLMNLVATPLVFGLGIDFGVYIVNRHEEEGLSDVPKVIHHTGGAILLTGLTTLAGFGSLLAADFAGLRSMGWVAVLGIGGCLAASLLILPLLLPRPR